MKRIIILTMCLVFCFSVIGFAKERKIKKVKKNHVNVETIMYEDKAGKIPIVVDNEEYGIERLQNEIAQFNKALEYIENLDCVKYKADKASFFRERLDFLNDIKTEMEK